MKNNQRGMYKLKNFGIYSPEDVDATPVALHVAKRVLTLPLYADLSMEDVDRIRKIVLEQKL